MITFIVLLVIALVLLFTCAFTVHTQDAAIIERFGRYVRTAYAGLNFKIPLVDKRVFTISQRVQQLGVVVETKTKDNVTVTMPMTVQYCVPQGSERDAYYLLGDPQMQITSLVRNQVIADLASLNFDDVYNSQATLASSVERELGEKMAAYGYRIIATLITDIVPDQKVKDSMNEINASQRKRAAAENLAEANKITQVKQAEADMQARILQGQGVAGERKAIAEGLAEQVETLRNAGVEGDPQTILLMTQYFDTMRDMARSGNSKVLFMPSSPQGMTTIGEEIRNAVIGGTEASASR